jgi:hypothetical protein
MKTILTKKHNKVEVPAQYQKEEGCIAFQLVTFTINFFGKVIEFTEDTKILENGKQIVVNGNGYINRGYELN